MLEIPQSRRARTWRLVATPAVAPASIVSLPSLGNRPASRPHEDDDASQEIGVERRLTRRLLSDWQRLCSGMAAPRVQDFVRAQGDWFDEHAFLLKADESPELSVFILYGSRLRADFGRRLTGMTVVEAAPSWLRAPLQRACEQCCDDGAPREIEGRARIGASPSRFRAIVLPLSGARNPIGYLLGTLSLDRTEG